MFLTIDVGNTQTAIGLFDGTEVVRQWRLSSGRERTKDEFSIMLRGLLEPAGYAPKDFAGAAMSSVVPPVGTALQQALEELVGDNLLVVGPGIKTGMAIRIDNPREVGADRIVNSVAAAEKYGTPVIAVDFGTSTNMDVVDAGGDYIGGSIAPGLEVSQDALINATAALRRVETVEPRAAIGKSTVEAIQSGLVYGHAGLVDGIVRRLVAELDETPNLVATGGLAPVIVPICDTVEIIDESLTLDGLRIIWERNR